MVALEKQYDYFVTQHSVKPFISDFSAYRQGERIEGVRRLFSRLDTDNRTTLRQEVTNFFSDHPTLKYELS